MARSKATTDHDTIRRWVEERGGHPARVAGTGGVGILRIEFPGFGSDERLERISWDVWFEKFDSERLAFLHEERSDDGQVSRFNKLVDRASVEQRPGAS